MICYDERREPFSDLIYKFEQTVAAHPILATKFPVGSYNHPIFMQQYGVAKKAEGNDRDYFDHEVYVAIASEVVDNEALSMKYKTEIVKLRNKIFHNEYPAAFEHEDDKKLYLTWLKGEIGVLNPNELITDKIFDIAEGYYNRLLEKVNAY